MDKRFMIDRREIREHLTLIDGVVLKSGRLAFCALFDAAWDQGVKVAVILYCDCDGKWARGPDFNLEPVSIAESTSDPGNIWLLGREGEIVCSNQVESIRYIDESQSVPGPFRKIRNLKDRLFVLGEDRSLWKQCSVSWVRVGAPTHSKTIQFDEANEDEVLEVVIDETEVAFGIAGVNAGSICLVGTGGGIWTWDDNNWFQEDSPTNMNLFDVCVDGEGNYTAVGQQGVIVEGGPNDWQAVNVESGQGDLCAVQQFHGMRFMADGSQLYVLDKHELLPIALAETRIPIRAIATDDHQIVSFSGKEVYRSADGKHWTPLL